MWVNLTLGFSGSHRRRPGQQSWGSLTSWICTVNREGRACLVYQIIRWPSFPALPPLLVPFVCSRQRGRQMSRETQREIAWPLALGEKLLFC